MRRLAYVLSATVLVSCVATPAANRPSTTTRASPSPASAMLRPTPSALIDAGEDQVMGPGGMTLSQEIGAVMMVGFPGPLTPAILDDWRRRQFGGLLAMASNRNASDSAGTRALIDSVRGVMAHLLLAATDQPEGDTSAVAGQLKAEGFDINLEPDVDVAAGQNPAAIVQRVTTAVAAMHAAGIYAVASVSAPTLQAQTRMPLRAAIEEHVDMVMVEAGGVTAVRSGLGFQGIVISRDLPSPAADNATRFLENGGDMVLIAHDLAAADAVYDAIHEAVLNGRYRRAQLDASVQKLLNLGLRFMP